MQQALGAVCPERGGRIRGKGDQGSPGEFGPTWCLDALDLLASPSQVLPRRYLKKLPLQANFYPMPVMAYIQDAQNRLTLHTAQALGVSSLHDGEWGAGAGAQGSGWGGSPSVPWASPLSRPHPYPVSTPSVPAEPLPASR